MNGHICSSIGLVAAEKVTATGVKLVSNNSRNRYIRITNLSDTPVYITPESVAEGEACPAVVKAGFALVGKGDYLELTNSSMFFCDFWGITDSGTADVAVLVGRA